MIDRPSFYPLVDEQRMIRGRSGLDGVSLPGHGAELSSRFCNDANVSNSHACDSSMILSGDVCTLFCHRDDMLPLRREVGMIV